MSTRGIIVQIVAGTCILLLVPCVYYAQSILHSALGLGFSPRGFALAGVALLLALTLMLLSGAVAGMRSRHPFHQAMSSALLGGTIAYIVLVVAGGAKLDTDSLVAFVAIQIATTAFVLLGAIVGKRLFPVRVVDPHQSCHCGYSLTGNTSGVCPECGTAVSSSPDQKL